MQTIANSPIAVMTAVALFLNKAPLHGLYRKIALSCGIVHTELHKQPAQYIEAVT